MTPEEAFEKWWDENWSAIDKEQIKDVYLAGAKLQENQQLLCLVQIREALGDKEGGLSQDELVERVKALQKRLTLLTEHVVAMHEALAWCYQVTDWPADGNSKQDIAMKNAESDFPELFKEGA